MTIVDSAAYHVSFSSHTCNETVETSQVQRLQREGNNLNNGLNPKIQQLAWNILHKHCKKNFKKEDTSQDRSPAALFDMFLNLTLDSTHFIE